VRNRTVLLPLLALPLAAVGCAGSHATAPQPSAVVHVTESDFHIAAPARIPAGRVRIVLHNAGPDTHELIVVRNPTIHLPLRSDGSTVNEETLRPVTIGALEPGAPGSTRELDLSLRPGTYELFCNMGGHYLGGMEAVVHVS
jgi:uncharacterized cupredoxin-like copper-binding protein